MKNQKTIYVKTSSYNLWWGIYGLSGLSSWEDIYIYDDPTTVVKLGSTCICTKNYFRCALEDLEGDPEEKEFVDQINAYLSDDKIHYHYYYDNPADEDFHQLIYNNLPINANGIKPRSFEMWHPKDGIEISVIEECVKVFCNKFLNLDVGRIELLEPINIDDAVVSYKEYLNDINSNIVFSDDLISEMMSRLSKSKEEILTILNRSL